MYDIAIIGAGVVGAMTARRLAAYNLKICILENVRNIEKLDDGYIIMSESESVNARYIVNAAGVYSNKIAAMVGDTSFTITPRRGEYILLDKECGGLIRTADEVCDALNSGAIAVSSGNKYLWK